MDTGEWIFLVIKKKGWEMRGIFFLDFPRHIIVHFSPLPSSVVMIGSSSYLCVFPGAYVGFRVKFFLLSGSVLV